VIINVQGDKMANQRKVVISSNEELAEELEVDEVSTISQEDIIDEAEEEINRVEDLPDDEEIWKDGPTAGMIKRWKEQFGEVYVTSITFDKHIAWRTLTRLEYKNVVKKMEQLIQAGQLSSAEANMWNEEAISELCILYPQYERVDMNGIMAGVPSLIAQEVLEASGFVALEVRQL
jgi:hypothetical protein